MIILFTILTLFTLWALVLMLLKILENGSGIEIFMLAVAASILVAATVLAYTLIGT